MDNTVVHRIIEEGAKLTDTWGLAVCRQDTPPRFVTRFDDKVTCLDCIRVMCREENNKDTRPIPFGLLPDWAIRRYITIEPFAEGEKRDGVISYGLTSYGYDVRLGTKFKVFTNALCAMIDPKAVNPNAFVTVEGDHCMIPPNSYILGESVEYMRLPRDVLCLCIGKSTLARCAAIVNVTPGEPEWEGRWTVEISNSSPLPLKVYAGEGIMQVLFMRAQAEPDMSYKDKKGKYQAAPGMQHAKVDGGKP